MRQGEWLCSPEDKVRPVRPSKCGIMKSRLLGFCRSKPCHDAGRVLLDDWPIWQCMCHEASHACQHRSAAILSTHSVYEYSQKPMWHCLTMSIGWARLVEMREGRYPRVQKYCPIQVSIRISLLAESQASATSQKPIRAVLGIVRTVPLEVASSSSWSCKQSSVWHSTDHWNKQCGGGSV